MFFVSNFASECTAFSSSHFSCRTTASRCFAFCFPCLLRESSVFLAINFAAQKTSVCALRFPLLKAESACVAFDPWLLVKAHVAGVNKGLLDFYFGFGHSSRDVELRTRIIDYSYMCVI